MMLKGLKVGLFELYVSKSNVEMPSNKGSHLFRWLDIKDELKLL